MFDVSSFISPQFSPTFVRNTFGFWSYLRMLIASRYGETLVTSYTTD